MQIRPSHLEAIDREVENGARHINSADLSVARSALDGSVSRMSGLDQLGIAHGHVMTGGIGSAHLTHEDFQKQFEWVSAMLQKTGRAIKFQNLAMQRMLLADGEPVPAQEITLSFPTRPARDTSDFPFNRPFVIRQPTIAAVEADLASTNTAAIDNASASWIDAAGQADQWASILSQAASDLAANNTGDWVDEAAARMNELAEQSRIYASNARTMSTTLGLMSLIPFKHQLQVQAARRAIDLITEPAHRTAAEQAYLQAFYATYEADLQYAVPPIRNLTMPAPHTTESQDTHIGMGGTATAGTGLDAATQLARSSIGAGAGALSGAATPTMAASYSPTTPVSGVTGLGVSPGGGAPVNASGGLSASPLATLMRHGIEPPRSIADHGVATTGGGGRHQAMSPIGSVVGGPGSRQGGPAFGGAGIGAPGGRQGGPGFAGPGIGAPGGRQGGPSFAGPAQQVNAAAASRGGVGMGGMPMGTGAGRESKGKVKRVTSKVEYPKNLRDLLGEARPVIPGVIGSWVRDS